MKYCNLINSYYQDQLEEIIGGLYDDKLSRFLREDPSELAEPIANNVYARKMFLEVEKYNTTLTDTKLLGISRTIIQNLYLKDLYNYVVKNPNMLRYYFNRKHDKNWLNKLYKKLFPVIQDKVNNN